MTSAIMLAVPRRGAIAVVADSTTAPQSPPVHTHHGSVPRAVVRAPARGGYIVAIVERIPDQRAMVCRNPGSLDYRRAEEYLRTRLYNCVWRFRRRWNKP